MGGRVPKKQLACSGVMSEGGNVRGREGQRGWRDKRDATSGIQMVGRSEVCVSGMVPACLVEIAGNLVSSEACRVALLAGAAR